MIETWACEQNGMSAPLRVIPYDDKSFAVEVSIPDTHPTTVRPFATRSAAEECVAPRCRSLAT